MCRSPGWEGRAGLEATEASGCLAGAPGGWLRYIEVRCKRRGTNSRGRFLLLSLRPCGTVCVGDGEGAVRPARQLKFTGVPLSFSRWPRCIQMSRTTHLSSIAQALRCSGCSSPKEARGRLEHRQRRGPHAHFPLATPSGQYHGAPVSNLALLHLHFSCPYPVRQHVAF